jgi:hypothetical protein
MELNLNLNPMNISDKKGYLRAERAKASRLRVILMGKQL